MEKQPPTQALTSHGVPYHHGKRAQSKTLKRVRDMMRYNLFIYLGNDTPLLSSREEKECCTLIAIG